MVDIKLSGAKKAPNGDGTDATVTVSADGDASNDKGCAC